MTTFPTERALVTGSVRKLMVAAALVAVALAGFAPRADAHESIAGGDYRIGTDLVCGTGAVAESLPVVSSAAPGQVAWEISQIYRFNASAQRWEHYDWSGWRYASVSGYGATGATWVDHASGISTSFAAHTVAPGAAYAIVQWTYADGHWQARFAVGSSGFGVCLA